MGPGGVFNMEETEIWNRYLSILTDNTKPPHHGLTMPDVGHR